MPPDHAAPRARWRSGGAIIAASAAALVGSTPVQAATVEVVAMNLTFAPATVTVELTGNEPGFTAAHAHVVWSVADAGTEHTITFDNPKLVSSGPLGVGKGHEVLIYEPGTYAYRCTIHPAMTGSIVVTPESTTTTVATSPTAPVTGVAAPAPVAGDRAGNPGTGVIVGIGAAGLAVAAALGWLLLRRRSGVR